MLVALDARLPLMKRNTQLCFPGSQRFRYYSFMSEFNTEELHDAIDRSVSTLLIQQGIEEPPVNAVRLIQDVFGYRVVIADDDDGEPGTRPPRRRPRELAFAPTHSPTAQQSLAARACAKEMLPGIFQKLGIVPGTEHRGAMNQMAAIVAPRLLLPTRWFERDSRRMNYDIARLRERYPRVASEWIAHRLLDFEELCVIAIVDDGTVSSRRGCMIATTKKLTEAEELCIEKVMEAGEPQTVRREGWTSRGFPIPDGPFNRIILRSVPDDV